MESNGIELEELCAQNEPVSTARFVFMMIASGVAVIGVFACKKRFLKPWKLVGVINNMIVLCVLAKIRSTMIGNALYMIVIAVMDWLLCAAYIYIFGLDALLIYTNNHILFHIWYV